MGNNAVIITRIIEGGATLPSTPPAQRNFQNTCFVYKGSKKGSSRINYVGTDLEAITDTYGSNSEVLKAAKTFLAGGFLGNTPRELYVGNIDTTTTELTAGDAVYDETDNALVISGATQSKFSDTELTYAEWTINSETVGAYGKYTDDTNHKLKLYETKASAAAGEAINLAEAPYSLSDNDATSTAVVYAENFQDALNEILGNSTVYYLIIDNTFSDDQKKIIMSSTEVATTTHFAFINDISSAVKYQDKDTDVTSLGHFASNSKKEKMLITGDDADKADEYKQASACSYYAQVGWTSGSPMGSLAFKTMSGITPSLFNEDPLVSTTTAWDNLVAKNVNSYANFTEVNAPAWYKGVTPSGKQAGDVIAKDFVLYQCDYNLFNMLTSVSKLPVNAGGAAKIEQTLALGLQRLNDAGVIGAGVAEDGEAFGASGFKVYAEVPTGADKSQGIWRNVVAKALLTGTTTKITYQIQFKQ